VDPEPEHCLELFNLSGKLYEMYIPDPTDRMGEIALVQIFLNFYFILDGFPIFRYIRLQRQKAVLQTRLKIPPSVHQFHSALDKQTGAVSR
jgi:hypothetical protein